jgi:transcriptional regulator with XRE-family HTH domain
MIQEWFGNRCRELRSQLGLSQEKFALKIGIDRTYYASVEAGKRNISLENIEKIIKGFGITFHDFFNC